MKTKVRIDGMSCQHCVGTVRKVLGAAAGVHAVDVQLGTALIESDEALDLAAIEAILVEEGFALVRD